MSTDQEFEKIAQDAIEAAERVDCPFEAFVDGLRSIVIDLKDRLSMAEDELRHRQGDD